MLALTTADLSEVRRRLDVDAAANPEVDRVPAHTMRAIRDHVLHGNPYIGGFMEAVLTNDLRGAVARADPRNRAALADIVAFLTVYCPSNSFGSAENVAAWGEAVRALNREAAFGGSTAATA